MTFLYVCFLVHRTQYQIYILVFFAAHMTIDEWFVPMFRSMTTICIMRNVV